MRISVIIPAYNEERNIISTLEEVENYLKKKFTDDWEIIVVDDGSRDKTAGLIERFIEERKKIKPGVCIHLLRNEKNRGKGASVRKGIFFAQGEIRLFMDADNSTRIREIEKFLPFLERGVDIIISSRKLKNSVIIKHQPFLRRFMSRIHGIIVSLLLGIKVSDYNCGFKVFKDKAAKELFSVQNINRWVFDAEILFLAKKYGFTVKEVPIIWEHKDTSKVKPFQATINSLREICRIKINELMGRYNRHK